MLIIFSAYTGNGISKYFFRYFQGVAVAIYTYSNRVWRLL